MTAKRGSSARWKWRQSRMVWRRSSRKGGVFLCSSGHGATALQRFSADRLEGGLGGGRASWRGGAGGSGLFWRGDEEVAGGLEEVEPEGADEVAVVAAADVLRAQGEAQREIETGGEIQHEGASDPEGGHEQRTRANSGEPQRSGAEREHAGRKRDVANVRS